jgi:uncharacterized protein YcbK (DUF882 family)
MIRQYEKGSLEMVGNNFMAKEFDCPCSKCTITLIDDDLILGLEAMRLTLNVPIRIHSGYRCADHQAALAASGHQTSKGVSQHELGKAADVSAATFGGLRLEAAARGAHFKSVGVAPTWVHVDTRQGTRQWHYSDSKRGARGVTAG